MKSKLPGYRKNIIRILSLFLMVFPWISYFNILLYSDMQASVLSNIDGMSTDLYFYSKQVILIIMAAFSVLFFLGERVFPDKKDNNVLLLQGKNRILFVLSGIFVLSALISTLFAKDAKTAWWGLPTEGEGFFALISYVAIMLMFYNYFGNAYALKWFKKSVLILSGITVVLGIIEYFYKPLIMIDGFKWLVGMGDYIETIAGNEVETFTDAVSLTFGNPNYFGGFVCVLFPFALSHFYAAGKKGEGLISGILSLGLCFCVISSGATTSLYVALFEVAFVTGVFVIKSCNKMVYIKTAAMIFTIVVFAVIFSVKIGGILKNDNSATKTLAADVFEIEDISLEENSVVLAGEDNALVISYVDGEIAFSDEKGQEIDTVLNENVFTFAEDDLENVSVKLLVAEAITDGVLAKLAVDAGYDDTIDFYILEDGSMSGVGQNNAIVADIKGAGVSEKLKKYYGIFTGRGYAWVNSLPMLKETCLIGKGPGHFAYYFKQNDYVGMLKTHRSTKYVIDKPHSMYLQYAINIGLVGMLAFVEIFVLTVVRGGKMLVKESKVRAELLAGVVAVCGFLIYAVVNDSVVSVMPVVMAVVGVMLAAGENTMN